MTPREEAYLRFKAAVEESHLRYKAAVAQQIEEHKAAQDRIASDCLAAVVVTVVIGALAIFAPLIAWLLL